MRVKKTYALPVDFEQEEDGSVERRHSVYSGLCCLGL